MGADPAVHRVERTAGGGRRVVLLRTASAVELGGYGLLWAGLVVGGLVLLVPMPCLGAAMALVGVAMGVSWFAYATRRESWDLAPGRAVRRGRFGTRRYPTVDRVAVRPDRDTDGRRVVEIRLRCGPGSWVTVGSDFDADERAAALARDLADGLAVPLDPA